MVSFTLYDLVGILSQHPRDILAVHVHHHGVERVISLIDYRARNRSALLGHRHVHTGSVAVGIVNGNRTRTGGRTRILLDRERETAFGRSHRSRQRNDPLPVFLGHLGGIVSHIGQELHMNDRLFIAYRIILFLHGETVHVLPNDQTHRRFRILAYLRQYQRSLTLYQGGKRRNGHRSRAARRARGRVRRQPVLVGIGRVVLDVELPILRRLQGNRAATAGRRHHQRILNMKFERGIHGRQGWIVVVLALPYQQSRKQ